MKSLPCHIPEAWKRHPFGAEPSSIGLYREYLPPPSPWSLQASHSVGHCCTNWANSAGKMTAAKIGFTAMASTDNSVIIQTVVEWISLKIIKFHSCLSQLSYSQSTLMGLYHNVDSSSYGCLYWKPFWILSAVKSHSCKQPSPIAEPFSLIFVHIQIVQTDLHTLP